MDIVCPRRDVTAELSGSLAIGCRKIFCMGASSLLTTWLSIRSFDVMASERDCFLRRAHMHWKQAVDISCSIRVCTWRWPSASIFARDCSLMPWAFPRHSLRQRAECHAADAGAAQLLRAPEYTVLPFRNGMPCRLFERATERHHCFAAGRALASRGVRNSSSSKGTVQRESPAPSCRRRDGGRR